MIEITQNYVNSFNNKNSDLVKDFFTDDSALYDPANPNGIFGIIDITDMISNLFDKTEDLEFRAINIFIDETKSTSIIEFELKLDDKNLKGVDVIKWNGDKISELRAYLY